MFSFQLAPIDKKILKKRLKAQTSFSLRTLVPSALFLLLLFWFINMPDSFEDSRSMVGKVVLIFQAILGIWTIIWRILKPENNPRNGFFCFWFNILGMILITGYFGIILFPIIHTKLLAILVLVILWLYLSFEIITINRFIFALYKPTSQKANIHASPCPRVFYRLEITKMLFFIPFLMFVLGILLWYGYNYDEITKHTLQEAYKVGGLLALSGTVFFPLSILAFLLKQTDRPSQFQRILRFIVWPIISPRAGFTRGETTSFRWWLSHPKQQWPCNIVYLGHFIDTNSFDWQNSNAWEPYWKQAQKKFQKWIKENDLPIDALIE